jgi:hypothetical protein
MTDLRHVTLHKIVNELLYSRKTEDEILNEVIESTYFTKFEASLIYIEALERIVQTVRNIGDNKNETKKKKLKTSNT